MARQDTVVRAEEVLEDVLLNVGLSLANDARWEDEQDVSVSSTADLATLDEASEGENEVLDLRDARESSRSLWHASAEGQNDTGLEECCASNADLEQLLQALLLEHGFLEEGVMNDPDVGAPTPTLREMRRMGPLGELSEGAQTTLLAGALYEYNAQAETFGVRTPLVPSTPQRRRRGHVSRSSGVAPPLQSGPDDGLRRQSRAFQETANLDQALVRTLSNPPESSDVGFSEADGWGSPQLAQFCTSLDRALRTHRRGSDGGMDTVRSARSILTFSSTLGQTPRRVNGTSRLGEFDMGGLMTASPSSLPSDANLSLSPRALWQHDFHNDELDEGSVSVLGFDSPSSVHLARSRMNLEVDPASPPNFSGTLDSFSGTTVSARTVLDDTATAADLTGNLAGVMQRLATENLSLDDTLMRSVRRVLQLGTVLTGQRLSDEEIHALPKVRFNQAEQQSCAICLEGYQQGELLNRLRCGHFFHVRCLTGWMQRATQCPLCRAQCGD